MKLRRPSSARLIVTLGFAGLLSGSVLAGVKMVSTPRIERNRRQALTRAIFEVVPGAKRFVARAVGERGRLVEANADAGEVVYAVSGEANQHLGYAIAASGPGFADTLGLIYGFDAERERITGFVVLESRETPGLGDKIMTDPAFLASFESLSVRPKIVAKTRAKRTADNEVDCISGATISSKAVVDIVQKSVDRWLPVLSSQRASGEGQP
jgi:electron transport complex protein RnfG